MEKNERQDPSERARNIFRGLTGRPKTRGHSLADRIDPLSFMRDPQLLDYEPTLGFRCFTKVAYGMELDSEERDFMALEFNGHTVSKEPEGGWSPNGYQECLLACGRRSTKSFGTSILGLYEACTSDYRETGHVSHGEYCYVVCIAQDKELAYDIAQVNMASFITKSPDLRYMVVQETRKLKGSAGAADFIQDDVDEADDAWQFKVGSTSKNIIFHTGIIIRVLAANSKAPRGRPYPVIILDEFGHFVKITGTQCADSEVLKAITPGGAQFGSRRKVFYLSNFSGQRGEFWNLFRDRDKNPGLFVLHAPTWLMNPPYLNEMGVQMGITDEFLDAEYAKNPMTFAQEYGAEPIDPTLGLIDGPTVDRCFDDHAPVPVMGEHPYRIMCIDPATKRDTFAIVIGHYDIAASTVVIDHVDGLSPKRTSTYVRNLRQVGLVIDEMHDPETGRQSKNVKDATTARYHVTPEEFMPLVTMLYNQWGCVELWADQHLAAMLMPALREAGLNARSFTYGANERKAMYMIFKTACQSERLKVCGAGNKWPEQLRREMKTVHVETTPRGDWAVKKGEDGDDFVDASAHLCRRLWGKFRIGAIGDWKRYRAFGGQGSDDGKRMPVTMDSGAKRESWRQSQVTGPRQMISRATESVRNGPRIMRIGKVGSLLDGFPRPPKFPCPY